MFKGIASRGPNLAPHENHNPNAGAFFIIFIIIGSFFIKNLFVGVVISTFNREQENLGKNKLLTD